MHVVHHAVEVNAFLRLDIESVEKDIHQELKTHQELGKTYYNQEDYVKAVLHYQRAVEISRALNDYSSLSENLLGKGNSNQRLNNFSNALQDYFELLELPKEILTSETKAITLNKIGSDPFLPNHLSRELFTV